MPPVTWPQAVRAEGALAAYTTALDYLKRLPHDEVVRRLEEKLQERAAVVAAYRPKGRV